MLAPQTVVIKLPMLKHLLIIFLVLDLFFVFQMSIQIMAISDLGETLMTQGLDAKMMLLNI